MGNSSDIAHNPKSNFYDLFFTTPVYDLAFFKKDDAAFSKGFTTTLQVKFYDHGITTLVNDLTLAWGQVNRNILTTSKVNECQSSLNIRLLIHAFYNYFVEQKFSLIFTILLPHIFFEKYTDNISQKLLRVSFISLYFILSKSEPSKYGPYHIDRIK